MALCVLDSIDLVCHFDHYRSIRPPMRESERRAYLFTLTTNLKHVEARIKSLKRQIRDANDDLEAALQQESDIIQSIAFLEGR